MLIDDREFLIKEITSRENVNNPEVAKFVLKTKNRENKDYTLEHFKLRHILHKNYPDIETLNTEEATYYIPSLKLYIDDRVGRNNNYNLFRPTNGIQQKLLNELITNNEEEMIRTWCIKDLNKSKKMESSGENYLEIYSFKNENDVITQVRRMDGLRIVYDKAKLNNEFENILTNPGRFDAGCYSNKITITYNPHFYEEEQNLYKKPITRRWVIENLMKYLVRDYEIDITDGEILRQFRISRICDGFSQHSPFWIKGFIEKYNIKSIYDFCGGWGHRFLGSWNIDYIYNDIDKRTLSGVAQIYNDFKDDYTTNGIKEFYNFDAAEFTPQQDYECVFSCPPYAFTEIYTAPGTSTEKHQTYYNWLNVWWKSVVKCSLKESVKYFTFIINNKYKEDMTKVCLLPEFNLEFVEEISLNRPNNVNHFHRIPSDGAKLKNIQKGEKLIILRKK